MLLDRTKRSSLLQEAPVILLILCCQLRRKQVEIRFPNNFAGLLIQGAAEIRIGEREPPPEIFSKDVLRNRLDQRVVERLGMFQGQFRGGIPRLEIAKT